MDENKNLNASDDEALDKELNDLKDTFKAAYNEAKQEFAAENEGPVIQELDAPEENPEDNEPEAETEDIPVIQPKKEKNPGKKHKGPLIAFIVIVLLLLVALGSYFAVTIIEPDFIDFATAYASASQTDNAEDAITAYKTALGYCTEDSKLLYAMRQEILEAIVLKTNEASGYAAAKTYMTENMTEDMIASPKSAEFKEFQSAGDNINDIADKALTVITDKLNGATDAADFDYDAVMKELAVSDIIKAEVKTALEALAEGVALENKAESKDDIQDAITSYFNAYSQFTSLEADGQALLETVVVKMYNHGYAYEAKLIHQNYFTEDMTEAYKTEGFAELLAEIDTIGTYTGDVYALAKQQFEAGAYTTDDFVSLLNIDIPERALKALAEICVTAAEGLKAESEHNLTLAATDYQTALAALETFSLERSTLAGKTCIAVFLTGDTQTANSAVESYFTDEVLAAADETTRKYINDITAYYNAQYAANEVFYPYYYNAYYYGSELDKDEIEAALDELITADSTDTDKAFVTYYKYLAEAFTDADNDTMLSLLTEFKSMVSAEYPMTYGYSLAELYVSMNDYENALKVAEEILAVNIADDYAVSVQALCKRINKDVDGALETALNGIELSGSVNYCAYEAAVDSMLKGDWATAYDYANQLYTSSLTTDHCELILVINALNNLEDGELKTEIGEAAKDVEDTYTQYSVTASDNAQALIDGTKTLEEVFLDGTFNFN